MSHQTSWMLVYGLIALALGVVITIPLLVLTIRADRRARETGGPRISARDNWNLLRASAFRFQDYLDANPDARTRLRLRQGLFTTLGLVAAGLALSVIGLVGSLAD